MYRATLFLAMIFLAFMSSPLNAQEASVQIHSSNNKTVIKNRNGLSSFDIEMRGKIVLTDLNITSASNTDGTISVDILPASNDVVSVRNQLLEIDLTNTTVSGTVDTVAAGGSSAGTGYTTTQNTY